MKDFSTFLIYLAVMAGVTYLIRMLPLVLFRRKIESRFIRSVLHYMPYAVLTAMTVPAVFSSTGAFIPSLCGFIVGVVLAFFERGLLALVRRLIHGRAQRTADRKRAEKRTERQHREG